jgi:hypothetical protein
MRAWELSAVLHDLLLFLLVLDVVCTVRLFPRWVRYTRSYYAQG